VGAGFNFDILLREPILILALTLGVITIKFLVLMLLSVIFRIKGRSRWLFSLSLAQAGEFGFVLLSFSTNLNVLPTALGERLLIVVALSMLITPLLFIFYDYLHKRMRDTAGDTPDDDDIVDEHGPVIIAGIGRFGQIVNRLVRNSGFETVVLDNDFKTIQLMRQFGAKGFFGDPTRPDVLRAAGLNEARVLVIALDDAEATTRLAAYARKERPDLHIIARARDRHHVFDLYKAGANDIVREMFDSSLRAGRYVLEQVGLTDFEAAEAEKAFYKHDRMALRELAKVWHDDIKLEDNQAYRQRVQELEQELEALLITTLSESRADPDKPE